MTHTTIGVFFTCKRCCTSSCQNSKLKSGRCAVTASFVAFVRFSQSRKVAIVIFSARVCQRKHHCTAQVPAGVKVGECSSRTPVCQRNHCCLCQFTPVNGIILKVGVRDFSSLVYKHHHCYTIHNICRESPWEFVAMQCSIPCINRNERHAHQALVATQKETSGRVPKMKRLCYKIEKETKPPI